jgi:toxin ParE1/3/4
MNVHWTDNAVADLQSIRATIARHSDRYALGMVRRIFDRAELLSDHPRIGSIVQEFEIDAIREMFEHPYRIIYRILPSRIDVLAVVHASRQLRQSLIEDT